MQWLVLAAALLLAPAPIDLIGIRGAPPGEGLPPGWNVKAVAGYPLPSYSIREEAGESILRIQGEGAAAWAYRELPVPIDLPIDLPIGSRKGTLGWSWRVLESPEGADLRVPERDDAPLRVYVVFGKPSGLSMRRARVIFYSWGNAEPAGLFRELPDRPRRRCSGCWSRVAGTGGQSLCGLPKVLGRRAPTDPRCRSDAGYRHDGRRRRLRAPIARMVRSLNGFLATFGKRKTAAQQVPRGRVIYCLSGS